VIDENIVLTIIATPGRAATADRVRKPTTRTHSMGSGLPGALQTLSNFLRTIIPCMWSSGLQRTPLASPGYDESID
jgi:hypothetical protein